MYENKEAGKETTSMGSRTSSTTSLETMNNQHGGVIKTPTEPTAPVSNNIPSGLKGKSVQIKMWFVIVLAVDGLPSVELCSCFRKLLICFVSEIDWLESCRSFNWDSFI